MANLVEDACVLNLRPHFPPDVLLWLLSCTSKKVMPAAGGSKKKNES
jgi:hypothetical protein